MATSKIVPIRFFYMDSVGIEYSPKIDIPLKRVSKIDNTTLINYSMMIAKFI